MEAATPCGVLWRAPRSKGTSRNVMAVWLRARMCRDLTAVGFEPTQLALVGLEPTPLDHSDKLSTPLAHHVSSAKIIVLRTASCLLATTRDSAPAPVGVDVDLGGYAIAAIGGPTRT